jgi:nucleotide-binding universal stress UspA family protein
MKGLHKILAAVDRADLGEGVLDVAATVASRVAAGVVALHAYQARVLAAADVTWVAPPTDVQELHDDAQRAIEAMVSSARARHPGVSMETLLVDAAAPQAIIDAIWSERPDLVVQGTHGRGFWARALLGNVARHVIRESPVPVLTVKAGDLGNPFRGKGPHTIVVPTDFSEGSDRVLDFALDLALRLDAKVRLLHCYPDPQPFAIERSLELALEVERVSRRRLEEVVAARRERGVDIVPATVCGSPARGIVEDVEASGAGMVMMATHDKGFAERVLTGSVALDVVRIAPVPVLTWWTPGKNVAPATPPPG